MVESYSVDWHIKKARDLQDHFWDISESLREEALLNAVSHIISALEKMSPLDCSPFPSSEEKEVQS